MPRISVVPHGDAEAEVEAEESRSRRRAAMDLSATPSLDSQVLGLPSFPPSPPSEPPDIRNWFSSYEYLSPVSAVLSFEPCGSVDDTELTATFDGVQELTPNCQSQERHERSQPSRFERLPSPEGNYGDFYHFKDGNFVGERNGYDQIRQGGSSLDDRSVVMEGVERAQVNGPQELRDGDLESGSAQILEIRTKHHGPSTRMVASNCPSEQGPSDAWASRRSGQLLLVTSDSVATCETCPRKELLLRDKYKQEGDHIKADGHTPKVHAGNSRENTRDLQGSWVSTRDSKRPSESDHENPPKEYLILKNRKHSHVERHGPVATRAALADRTNHLQEPSGAMRAPEVLGKWQCPRKNKAERGPPLKQLRLESWVRRVV